MDMSQEYVHGYSERETQRLRDQARTLSALLHYDTFYLPESKVLEAGCGVGSQTIVLAKNNPQVSFVCVDSSRRGITGLYRAAETDGTFNYTFFKGVGTKP